jgi:hypothetical protein
MTQVHISSQAHTVTVNHDGGDLAYIIEKAQKLYEDTKPPESPAGPAFGFSAERDHRRDGFAWNLGEGGQPAVKP